MPSIDINGDHRTFWMAHALNSFVGVARAACVLVDACGHVIFTNPAATQLLRGELAGRPITDIMDDRTAAAHVAGFTAFLRDRDMSTPYLGTDHYWDARLLDGSVCKIGIRISAWRDPFQQGEPCFGAWLWEKGRGCAAA